jgi:hypothetical protein
LDFSHGVYKDGRGKKIVVSRWGKGDLKKPATKFKKYLYFDKDCVDDFLKNYLTTKEVARLLEISVLPVQIWARADRLKPVCGRGINGGHEYHFRLDVVEVYKKENLMTAPQMAKQ